MGRYQGRLKKCDWEVRSIALEVAQILVKYHHYSAGGSNTSVYCHGLFRKGEVWQNNCVGCTWWIPPTKSAALATYPQNWNGVLSLSRLVILPDIQKNAASFLLGRSMRMVDRSRWPCLVTYADSWRGHTGSIYKATNWEDWGLTKPEPVYTLNGRMISRKAGPKTRTKLDMLALGCRLEGKFPKRKFVHRAKQ
jgi:hypothetical protein